MGTCGKRHLMLLVALVALLGISLVLWWQVSKGHTSVFKPQSGTSDDLTPFPLPVQRARPQDVQPTHHAEASGQLPDAQHNALGLTEALMGLGMSMHEVGQTLAHSPKNAFFRNATPQEQSRGREVMHAMRHTMNFPDHLSLQVVYRKPGEAKPSHAAEIRFTAPSYYREDASGGESYSYITDGVFELSDYWVTDGVRPAGIVPRDEDSKMFLELFPARLQMDTDLVWLREDFVETRVNDSIARTAVSVVGSWFYDLYVSKEDNLPMAIVFYSRLNRSREMVRITNIAYKAVNMDDPIERKTRQCMLPVSYSVDNPWHTRTFNVTLNYPDSAANPIDRAQFRLSLKPLEP